MRILYSALVLGALSACAPILPDSAAGIGFDNSAQARRAREAALAGSQVTGQPLAPPMAVASETLDQPPVADADDDTDDDAAAVADAATAPMAPTQAPMRTAASAMLTAGTAADATDTTDTIDNADIAAEAAAALAASGAGSAARPVQAVPTDPAPAPLSNPGLSDENDFSAVASRETIDSDAERIARNRAQYTEVAATALPARNEEGQPNIVRFALQTRHPRGTRMYNRSGLGKMLARSMRNCEKFGSPDLAQIEFLASGGPKRDRKGLDPDGDGYACGWDPEPFRRAVQN